MILVNPHQHPARHRKTPLLAAALFIVIVGFPVASPLCQTTRSMRIRSLGNSFAGIVEDAHTDAFLNPARVGDLPGKQFYAARLPGESLWFPFPDNGGLTSYDDQILPNERSPGDIRYEWRRSYTPYTIGFVTPVLASAKLSLAVDAAATGSDDLSNSDDLDIGDVSDDRVEFDRYTTGRDYSLYHVVADAALGTGGPQSDGTRFGVRVRVEYDQMQHNFTRIDERTRTYYPFLSEMTYAYDYDYVGGDYESTSGELSLGLFRNAGFLSQAVLGGGGRRETLVNSNFLRSIYDEDYDGNGRDIYGAITPAYEVDDRGYDGDRSYDSYRVFSRFGLRWSDTVRSFHTISWGQSDGDGDAGTWMDYYHVDYEITERATLVDCVLDGDSKEFVTSHAIGYVENVRDNLLMAIGLQARFEYEKFEEDGDGPASVNTTQGTTEAVIESPYLQLASWEREYWFLNFPIGLEWSFHRNVAWRFGTQVRATRVETTGSISRELGLLNDPDLGGFYRFQDGDRQINYQTEFYFNMGFGFTIWDMFSLDVLTAATTGSFNAATVSTAQLTYRF